MALTFDDLVPKKAAKPASKLSVPKPPAAITKPLDFLSSLFAVPVVRLGGQLARGAGKAALGREPNIPVPRATPKQVIGDAASLALIAATAGVPPAATATRRIISSIPIGAGFGAAGAAGENAPTKDILRSAATGAVVAPLLQGGSELALKGIARLASRNKPTLPQAPLATEQVDRGQLTQLLSAAKEQAAKQIDRHAPEFSNLVRRVDLGDASTINQAEHQVLEALRKARAPQSAFDDVSAYFRTFEQARFFQNVAMKEGITPIPALSDAKNGVLRGPSPVDGSNIVPGLKPAATTQPASTAVNPVTMPSLTRGNKDFFNFARPRTLPEVSTAPAKRAFNNPIRSVESRLEALGPQGQKVLQRFREADTVGLVNTGKVTKALKDIGLPKLSRAESQQLGDALRGTIRPETMTPKVRAVFDVVDAYRTGVPLRARSLGIQIKTSQGKTFDFPESKPNYFPQNVPNIKLLKKGILRDEILDNVVKIKRFNTPQQAADALDSYIAIIETNGRTNKDFFARKLVAEGQAKNVTQAKGQILRFFRASRQQRYGNLERAREFDSPFYDPNPQRVIPRYVENVERRVSEAELFGPNLEKIDTLLGSIKDPDAQVTARLLVKVARGARDPGDTMVEKLLSSGRHLSTFRLGPLSAITNLGQNVNTLLRSDAPSLLKGIVRGLRPVGKDLAIESGAIAQSSLRQVEKIAGGDGGIVSGYLRKTGFTPSERFNRVVSANAGWSYIQKLTKRLLRNPSDRFAIRELSAFELNPADIVRQGGLTKNDLLRGVKVFVDHTQFRSRPIDLPASFTATTLGQNLSQFKTFSYQQGRFIAKQTIDQMHSGGAMRAIRNIGILATIFPLTGEAIADIRSALQGRKRTTTGLARYFENLTYVGGLGLLTDTVQSLKYNPSEFLLGPSAALLTRNAQALYKATTGTISQGDKRQLINQIPLLGPFLGHRIFPPKR